MITIVSTNNSSNVAYVESNLARRGIDKTTIVANINNLPTYINTSVVCSNIVICIGDTFLLKQCIARVIDVPLLYDKATEGYVVKHCKQSNQSIPAQHALDSLSSLPEGFTTLAGCDSLQCACYGKFKKTIIYILPDSSADIAHVFSQYIAKTIDNALSTTTSKIYKIFGLSNQEINNRLGKILNSRIVSHYCETTPDLVSTVNIRSLGKLTTAQSNSIDNAVMLAMGSNLYATSDISLAQQAVELLLSLHKTVAIAESITGGLLSSAFVDVAGASRVLLESAVTYTVSSKHRRLGINPHMIDAFGVVSSNVATAMVDSVKQQSGADFALSTTGFAGPTSGDNMPVGLCYIGVANGTNSKVFKLQFSGDRQNIRRQAVNSALLLLINTIKNVKI